MTTVTLPFKVLVAVSLVGMLALGLTTGYVVADTSDLPAMALMPMSMMSGSMQDMGMGDVGSHMEEMDMRGMTSHMKDVDMDDMAHTWKR